VAGRPSIEELLLPILRVQLTLILKEGHGRLHVRLARVDVVWATLGHQGSGCGPELPLKSPSCEVGASQLAHLLAVLELLKRH